MVSSRRGFLKGLAGVTAGLAGLGVASKVVEDKKTTVPMVDFGKAEGAY